ncbi:MAG: sulfite exporter TauE/SafE family protein [Rhodospirillales bacterium]
MTFDGLTLTTILIAISAMALGCAFQTALGLGFALLAAPVLVLLDPAFVPGPMLLAGVVLAALTAYGERDAIDHRMLSTCLIGLAAGTVIGALTLWAVAGMDLRRLFGVMILLAVGVSLMGKTVASKGRSLLAAAGISGIMGTMAGLHGPAISLAFQNAEPRVARAMLGAYFTAAYLSAVAAQVLLGAFGAPEVGRTIVLLPGVAVGLALAPVTRRYVNRDRLRIAILAIAAVSGLILVLK